MSVRASLALLLPLSAACGLPPCLERMPATPEEERAIIDHIRSELGDEVHVERLEGAFFTATNDTPGAMAAYRGTLQRMIRHLYAEYFTKRPDRPILVYLFRDKPSYDAYCRSAFRAPPATPYGFYLARERKMVMNISTGTGTLAHEIVHPLLGEDLPGAPAWFNEGFASLYEQSLEFDGRMLGRVNWRLPGLQAAIRAKTAPSLAELLALSPERFYGDGRGIHYAAARYLCLYLQERGELGRFYRRFKGGLAEDPDGRKALVETTGRSLEAYEAAWKDWILALRNDD